jgi:hypothetical protein
VAVPPAVADALGIVDAEAPLGLEVVAHLRHDVRGLAGGEVEAHDVRAQLLHVKRQVARRRPELQDPLARHVDIPQVAPLLAAQVPHPLDEPCRPEVHRVVELALPR